MSAADWGVALLVLAVGVVAIFLALMALAGAVRLWRWLVGGVAEFRDEWGGEPRMMTFAPSWWRVCGRGLWRFTTETRQATGVLLRFRTASSAERQGVADSIFGLAFFVAVAVLFALIAG